VSSGAHIFSRFLHDKRGVAAVEAAIITPFLAVLALGAIDGSYMLLQNHKMEQALVAAANFMSIAEDPRLVEGAAKKIAVTGTTDPAAAPRIKNWTTDDITIDYKMVSNQNGNYRGGAFIRVVDIRASSRPLSLFTDFSNGTQRSKPSVSARASPRRRNLYRKL